MDHPREVHAPGARGSEHLHPAVERVVEVERALERVIEFPRLSSIVRTSLPQLVETTVLPLVLFYVVFHNVGLGWALVAGLGWSYCTLLRYVIRRQRIPGLLVISTVLLSARALIAFLTGSVFVYFLQPTLSQFVMAVLFCASAMWRRPLVSRLAADFCAFPEAITADRAMGRFFRHVSLVWSAVFCCISGGTFGLLVTQTTGVFLLSSSAVTVGLVLSGIAVSVWLFRRSMRGHGIRLAWAPAS